MAVKVKVNRLTRQINSDCQKLRRFALHLSAAGYLRRYVARIYNEP